MAFYKGFSTVEYGAEIDLNRIEPNCYGSVFFKSTNFLNNQTVTGFLQENHFKYKSLISEINYKNFHAEGNWKIPLSGPMNAIAEDGLFEIPIASKPAGLIMNLKHLYYKRKNRKHAYSSGRTIHTGYVSKIDKLKFVFSSRPLGFDIISLSPKDLMNIMSDYINSQKYSNDIIISSLSHPKNMGPYSVQLMEEFVDRVRNKFHDVQFCTFSDIYNEVII